MVKILRKRQRATFKHNENFFDLWVCKKKTGGVDKHLFRVQSWTHLCHQYVFFILPFIVISSEVHSKLRFFLIRLEALLQALWDFSSPKSLMYFVFASEFWTLLFEISCSCTHCSLAQASYIFFIPRKVLGLVQSLSPIVAAHVPLQLHSH